jgi:hypothetical protein
MGTMNLILKHGISFTQQFYLADPPILEWVFKASSRIHRASSSAKPGWKYQGDGAWTLTEKSKKKPKACKRGKAVTNAQIASAYSTFVCGTQLGSGTLVQSWLWTVAV